MLPLELPTAPQGWFDFLAARCDHELETAQRIVDRVGEGAGDFSGRLDTAGTLADWNTITLCLQNATSVANVIGLAHPDGEVRERARQAELAAATMGTRIRQDPRLHSKLAALDAGRLDEA